MSLYLKYRPRSFDELVWQEFIKTTLKNAIIKDMLVWAYLFWWPRWTWKTSTARIFAKTINCLNPKNWNPCLECDICRDFSENKLIDIIEIDAASYTWVDNIREIIERSRFRPNKAKYKVYIIDEVHMLSKWAFNALLKILEEPPEFVKFILATTEMHKIPETILSRCQRYDFKNWTIENIKERLTFIAKNEKIKIDDKSLNYIANSSSWWYRNAINLFEQLIVWNEINYENVISSLWLVSDEKLEIFLDKLLTKDKSIIDDFDDIINKWKNLKLFFKELIFFTKDKSLEKLKSWESISEYINILESLNETYSKTKNSLDENITFLIWILKIINDKQNSKVEKLEIKKEKQKLIEKKQVIKKEEKNEKIEEIKHEDIMDIFDSDNWSKDEEITKEDKKDFDKDKFIENLKSMWAKWSLTMSLRWSDMTLNLPDLYIKFKTKIALNSVDKSENIALLNSSLEMMWLEWINPKLS